MDGKFSLSSLKAMVNPGLISGLAAVLIIVLNIPLPGFLMTAVTYLGNVTSPMALVAVGFALAHTDPKRIFCQPKLYVFSVVKLLALPLLMLPLVRLATKDAALLSVCMVMFQAAAVCGVLQVERGHHRQRLPERGRRARGDRHHPVLDPTEDGGGLRTRGILKRRGPVPGSTRPEEQAGPRGKREGYRGPHGKDALPAREGRASRGVIRPVQAIRGW